MATCPRCGRKDLNKPKYKCPHCGIIPNRLRQVDVTTDDPELQTMEEFLATLYRQTGCRNGHCD